MLELPAFFQPESNPAPVSQDPKKLVEHYEKITLSLAIHSRMLRLHRPWLSRGYEDERCVSKAKVTDLQVCLLQRAVYPRRSRKLAYDVGQHWRCSIPGEVVDPTILRDRVRNGCHH